jgi:hypothetical protein
VSPTTHEVKLDSELVDACYGGDITSGGNVKFYICSLEIVEFYNLFTFLFSAFYLVSKFVGYYDVP